MPALMPSRPAPGLERSCGPAAGDWIRIAPAQAGIERIEARFAGRAYEPHRHDTYAIGLTLEGVQSFGYRGAERHSLAGQMLALHPDETHDGRAGTEHGFRYRMLYVDPALIADAMGGGRPLPFVRDAVNADPRLAAALVPALADLDRPLDDLARDQAVAALADAIAALDPSGVARRVAPRHWRAVRRMRELLDANLRAGVSSDTMERETGLTRYAAARHFRACFGASPHRYLLMRRLDRARALIRGGVALADAAHDCGFADQSHMTRHFADAYGMTPGKWAALALGSRLASDPS